MPVDVSTEVEIARPRADVADFASDPDNATAWYQNIKALEWKSPRPTYCWRDTPSGGTHMTLRNRGEPSGFPKLAAPLMAKAMRRANRKDLGRLKALLEAPR